MADIHHIILFLSQSKEQQTTEVCIQPPIISSQNRLASIQTYSVLYV